MARPKKQPDERRTEHIGAYVTPAQRVQIERTAARAGLSISEYIRAQTIEGRVIIRQHRALAPEIVMQIQRLGVLFNQLVRLVHQHQRIPPEVAQAAATIERLLIEQVDCHGAEGCR